MVRRATPDELLAHEQLLVVLDKASRGKTAWRRFEPVAAESGVAAEPA